MDHNYTMVLTNCRDDLEADYITKALLQAKLAACIQTNKVHSHYFRRGKVTHDSEIRLLIKTRKDSFEDVEAMIKRHHSYELPEIVEIPINRGSQEFFNWIDFVIDN